MSHRTTTAHCRVRTVAGLLGALLVAGATVAVAPAGTAADLAFPSYIRKVEIGKLDGDVSSKSR